MKIGDLINGEIYFPKSFLHFSKRNLINLKSFADASTLKINKLLSSNIDERKTKLFDIVYATNGLVPIKQLSDTVYWSRRQINRYFTEWFGLTLKKYCNILRYRASFKNLKEGKLFPEESFTDQAHFIKEIKKFSGVTPKELSKNENDRFIQLSTLVNQ